MRKARKMSESRRNLMIEAAPATYYRRELPPNLTPFASREGKLYFKEALNEGYAEGYFGLVENFTTQSEPEFCGLGSLTMVLNALEVDPGRTWKGVWRWYSDEMLDCCAPLEIVKQKGITLAEFACLAKCNGINVVVKRRNKTTKEQFLEDLATVSMSIDKYMVISFSRKSMGQTGNGHYSPIATYNPGRRQALVLDVARFKYPSYWAPVDLLWDAMEPHDPETDAPRGYFILARGQRKTRSLCKITSECPMYLVGDIVRNRIPAAIALKSPVESVDELVRIVLSSVPKEHSFSLSFARAGNDLAGPGLAHEHETDLNKLIEEIKHNELYQIVEKAIGSCDGIFSVNEGNNAQIHAALGTIFLLACPCKTFANASPNIQRCLNDYRSSASASDILREEIMHISEQIAGCCDRVSCEQE